MLHDAHLCPLTRRWRRTLSPCFNRPSSPRAPHRRLAGDIEAYLGASLYEVRVPGAAAAADATPPRTTKGEPSPRSTDATQRTASETSIGGLSDDFDDFEDRDSGESDGDFLPPPTVTAFYSSAAETAHTENEERKRR